MVLACSVSRTRNTSTTFTIAPRVMNSASSPISIRSSGSAQTMRRPPPRLGPASDAAAAPRRVVISSPAAVMARNVVASSSSGTRAP